MSKEHANNPTRKDARMDNSKRTHARMRSQRLTIGATAATLMLAAGGAAFGYHLTHHHGNPPTPPEATPTAPACEDGSPTPIGTCLHPASVQ